MALTSEGIYGLLLNWEKPLLTSKSRCGEMTEKREGKIVYIPAERCWSNILIEETPHGYKLYRSGKHQHFAVIPHSHVKSVEYKG